MSIQAMQQAIEALQDAEEVLHFQRESKRLSTISPAIEALKAAIDEIVKKETSKKNLEGLLAYANPGNRLEEYANHILTSCTRCGGSGCEQDAKPEQDEEPVAWFSLTSKTFSTVETSHHTAPLFLHPTPPPEPTHDEGPNKEKALELAHRWCSRYRHGEEFPYLFNEYHLLEFVRRLHPATRPEFMRLSEEEITRIGNKTGINWNLPRAIEDALEKKNDMSTKLKNLDTSKKYVYNDNINDEHLRP